jgi:hypothetical protein
MTDSSGCDPRGAMLAHRIDKMVEDRILTPEQAGELRVTHDRTDDEAIRASGIIDQFKKDLSAYGISPIEGIMTTLSIEQARKQFNKAMGFIDDLNPETPQAILKTDLTDEEYQKLLERWLEFDPRLKIVITQPMAYIPMDEPAELLYPDGSRVIVPSDPGDETKPQCPSTIDVNDSVSSGWTGMLGDEVQCELVRGHDGDHQYTATWNDLMAHQPI